MCFKQFALHPRAATWSCTEEPVLVGLFRYFRYEDPGAEWERPFIRVRYWLFADPRRAPYADRAVRSHPENLGQIGDSRLCKALQKKAQVRTVHEDATGDHLLADVW